MPFPVSNAALALKSTGSEEQSVVEALQGCHAFRHAATDMFPPTNASLERTPAEFGIAVAEVHMVCNVCGMSFDREDTYRRHVKTAH